MLRCALETQRLAKVLLERETNSNLERLQFSAFYKVLQISRVPRAVAEQMIVTSDIKSRGVMAHPMSPGRVRLVSVGLREPGHGRGQGPGSPAGAPGAWPGSRLGSEKYLYAEQA